MTSTHLETRAHPCPAPPRYKSALLTFLGLLASVYFIPPALTARFPEHPFIVVALAVASIVVFMTYLIMPPCSGCSPPGLRA